MAEGNGKTLIARTLAGEVLDPDAEVDDAIDAWHDGDTNVELHEWLGLTRSEYRRFVECRETLRSIANKRKVDQ